MLGVNTVTTKEDFLLHSKGLKELENNFATIVIQCYLVLGSYRT